MVSVVLVALWCSCAGYLAYRSVVALLRVRWADELGLWSYFRIGAGRASAKAALAARRGRPKAEDSEGNGVAIRVAPLAIAFSDRDDDLLDEVVDRNGRATHDSNAAIAAARFVAHLIKRALSAPMRAFDDRDELEAAVVAAAKTSGFEVDLARAGTSGHVHQCVNAVAAVLLEHGLDFDAAMEAIFSAGGDTDSIGAMVGAVIGAQVGADGLPDRACEVQHRELLLGLADRLADRQPVSERAGAVVRVVGDIATRPVDAIVNAWNRNAIPPWLLLPRGVSKSIREAGGQRSIREVGARAPIPLGMATETEAGELPCRWVIHAAAINLAWRASPDSVTRATRSALRLAHWLGAKTVAVPLLGAGSGGLPADMAEEIIEAELRDHRNLFDRLELVVLE